MCHPSLHTQHINKKKQHQFKNYFVTLAIQLLCTAPRLLECGTVLLNCAFLGGKQQTPVDTWSPNPADFGSTRLNLCPKILERVSSRLEASETSFLSSKGLLIIRLVMLCYVTLMLCNVVFLLEGSNDSQPGGSRCMVSADACRCWFP